MKTKRFLLVTVMALASITFLFAQQNNQQKVDNEKDVWGWDVKDYKPYIQAFKDLERLTKEYADDQLRIALDQYITGIDILRDMRERVDKIIERDKREKHLNEKWYWQEIDRKNALSRQIAKMKYEAKLKSVTYFTRAIATLDKIENDEVRKSKEFKKFQSYLYQIYVSAQYDIGNLPQCIPILERYLLIDEKHKGDFRPREQIRKDPKRDEIIEQNKKAIWAYRYLANCYAFKENLLKKTRGVDEAEIEYYRRKKNEALLKATELYYGKNSPQYKKIFERVALDEKVQRRVSDFQ